MSAKDPASICIHNRLGRLELLYDFTGTQSGRMSDGEEESVSENCITAFGHV